MDWFDSWYDYEMQNKYCDSRFVDLNGEPIKRTPFSHPYNYDEYVCWKDRNFNKEKCNAVYSDRLFQWDYEKYNKCCQEVFKNRGQSFDKREPREIEKFLGMYFGKKIRLTAVVQGCNQATGYPYWVFFYEERKDNMDFEYILDTPHCNFMSDEAYGVVYRKVKKDNIKE